MSEVKRYSVDEITRLGTAGGSTTRCEEVEKPTGRYVLWTDYAAAEKRAREAERAAELAHMARDAALKTATAVEARCARLERYAQHLQGCNRLNPAKVQPAPCTCGLDAALAPGEAGKGEG